MREPVCVSAITKTVMSMRNKFFRVISSEYEMYITNNKNGRTNVDGRKLFTVSTTLGIENRNKTANSF